MTNISKDEVARIAGLGAIRLSDDQITRLSLEMAEILGYVEQLSELNTEGVEPTYQVTDLVYVTRPDEIIEYGLSREQLLKNAPEQANNQIKVPKVL
jgi:aspartyl-tRNA(Asn)/glutamyl-tRNA(Gln) amidotransferase subunit C